MNHPLHPALVHFPIACWSLATLADLAGAVGMVDGGEAWWRFAGATMAIGTVTALAAMATGFVDFIKLAPEHPAARAVQGHMHWVALAWSCYATSLFLRVDGLRVDSLRVDGLRLDGMTLTPPELPALALSVGGFIALAVAGWLGGTLVHVHGLGRQMRVDERARSGR